MNSVRATRHSDAPVEEVWALLSDASAWKDWAAFTVSELERTGEPEPDGVGAIRRFGFPVYTSREQVLEFDPPRHLAYTLLAGIPLRNYRADVTLTPGVGGGTDIEWVSRFEAARGTGWFWTGFMRVLLADFTRRLARAASRP